MSSIISAVFLAPRGPNSSVCSRELILDHEYARPTYPFHELGALVPTEQARQKSLKSLSSETKVLRQVERSIITCRSLKKKKKALRAIPKKKKLRGTYQLSGSRNPDAHPPTCLLLLRRVSEDLEEQEEEEEVAFTARHGERQVFTGLGAVI